MQNQSELFKGAMQDFLSVKLAQAAQQREQESGLAQRKSQVLGKLQRLSPDDWDRISPDQLHEIMCIDNSRSWHDQVLGAMNAASQQAERASAQQQAHASGATAEVERLEAMSPEQMFRAMAESPDGGRDLLRAMAEADRLG